MNALDLIIALLLAFGSIYGLIKGFVRIAIGISGLIVSVGLALRLATRGTDWFSGAIDSPEMARMAAFLAVLLAGLVATAAAAWLVWRIVKAAHVDWIDRLVGGAVGLVGATFVVCGLLVALTTFLPSGSPLLARSTLVPIAIRVADFAAAVLPPDMAETYEERRRALEPLADPEPGRPVRLLDSQPEAAGAS
jgi:uncharacterized membrane protein required for colicin V production